MKPFAKKEILCVIPARYGSMRLPGKPLLAIGGLPLVMWAYNRAAESGVFADVCVAADDPRIIEAVERHGGRAVMTSAHHASGTDRVFEVARTSGYGYVVNLQGDEPAIPVAVLRDFAETLVTIDTLSLLTCVSNAKIEEADNPNIVKVVLAANNDALYFSRARIPFDRDNSGCVFYKHTGVYGFSQESLALFCSLKRGVLEEAEKLEQLRALENGMKIHTLVRNYQSVNIDTKEDLDLFRAAVAGR